MMRSFALATLTAFVLWCTSAIAQNVISYGSPAPASGPEAAGTNALFDRLEKSTAGQLRFERAYDGKIVNYRNSLPALRDGLVDAAMIVDVFFLNDMKTSNTAADLAMVVTDPWVSAGAASETLLLGCPQCEAEWARLRIRPLAFNGSSPFSMMCRSQFATLDSLKGKSIRGASAFQTLAKAMGATPVATSTSEVFEAMQRGAIECAIGQITWLRQFGLAEVAKYVVEEPLGLYNSSMVLAFNASSWRKLSATQRKLIIDQLPFLVAEATEANVRLTQEIRKDAEAKGVMIAPPSPDFKSFVAKYRESEYERAARDGATRGVERPDQLVAAFRANVLKWQAIVSQAGGDRAKYEEALRREIFSKISF